MEAGLGVSERSSGSVLCELDLGRGAQRKHLSKADLDGVEVGVVVHSPARCPSRRGSSRRGSSRRGSSRRRSSARDILAPNLYILLQVSS